MSSNPSELTAYLAYFCASVMACSEGWNVPALAWVEPVREVGGIPAMVSLVGQSTATAIVGAPHACRQGWQHCSA